MKSVLRQAVLAMLILCLVVGNASAAAPDKSHASDMAAPGIPHQLRTISGVSRGWFETAYYTRSQTLPLPLLDSFSFDFRSSDHHLGRIMLRPQENSIKVAYSDNNGNDLYD